MVRWDKISHFQGSRNLLLIFKNIWPASVLLDFGIGAPCSCMCILCALHRLDYSYTERFWNEASSPERPKNAPFFKTIPNVSKDIFKDSRLVITGNLYLNSLHFRAFFFRIIELKVTEFLLLFLLFIFS